MFFGQTVLRECDSDLHIQPLKTLFHQRFSASVIVRSPDRGFRTNNEFSR